MAKNKKGSDAPVVPPNEPRLAKLFEESVRAQVAEKFEQPNPMSQPKIEKIVINVNIGRHLDGTKVPANVRSTVIDTLTQISGQKPILVRAKKSVSNFKVREGYESAVMVTMRRDRMWHFLDRLIHLAAPRIKDFRGLPTKSFDRQGNYSFGLVEQGVFPEINMAEVNFTHDMHINVVFKNSDAERSRFVLEQLGMPFKKPEEKRR
ncbi:MAG: 50S ribosomal protein L5 [Planctomycetota bacterium]